MSDFQGTFVTQQANVTNPHRAVEETRQKLSHSAQTAQSTLLNNFINERDDLQQKLEEDRDNFEKQMLEFKEKEEKLIAKQDALRQEVARYDRFLEDVRTKKQRYDNKRAEEREARLKHEQTYKDLLLKKDQMISERDKKKKITERDSRYRIYLLQVIESLSDEQIMAITEPELLIAREKTLRKARKMSAQSLKESRVTLGETRTKLQSELSRLQNEIYACNHEVAMRRNQFETLRGENQQAESQLQYKLAQSKEISRNFGEIQMAINNLYSRCTIKTKNPGTKNKDGSSKTLFEKIDYIQGKIIDWIDVENMVLERQELLHKQGKVLEISNISGMKRIATAFYQRKVLEEELKDDEGHIRGKRSGKGKEVKNGRSKMTKKDKGYTTTTTMSNSSSSSSSSSSSGSSSGSSSSTSLIGDSPRGSTIASKKSSTFGRFPPVVNK